MIGYIPVEKIFRQNFPYRRFVLMAKNVECFAQDKLRKKVNNSVDAKATPQGFGFSTQERLPVPDQEAMSEAQKAAAEAIINGPRKAIFGPFVPLLQTPLLMECLGKTGEALRFNGSLPDRIRELVICVVARETGNQFEWQTHAPLAVKAGVAAPAIDAIAVGRRPRGLSAEEECAVDFVIELICRNGVSDETYAGSVACFGQPGTVELTALVGYFVMVCWVMNVARTPGPKGSLTNGLKAFPE
jgi:4-carboxymuconolactone decarboxylase